MLILNSDNMKWKQNKSLTLLQAFKSAFLVGIRVLSKSKKIVVIIWLAQFLFLLKFDIYLLAAIINVIWIVKKHFMRT